MHVDSIQHTSLGPSHLDVNPEDEIARAASIDRWREGVDPPHKPGLIRMVRMTWYS